MSNGTGLSSEMDRWVVVHAGHRDWYQLPVAFAETDRLAKFVTDWYTPLDRDFWHSTVPSGSLPPGLRKRFNEALSSSLVVDEKAAFLSRYVWRRLSGRPFRDDIEGLRLGKIAAREAKAQKANLLASSYHGSAAFSNAPANSMRALFQVHPHPRYLRRLYHSTIARHPTYSGLKQEPEMLVSEAELRTWELESSLADVIVCASTFTARSLTESGIEPSKVRVVPYGINSDVFTEGAPGSGRPFTALYVGQKVARKSIGLLLTVWRDLQPKHAQLIVVGGYVRDSLLDDFTGVYQELPVTQIAGLVERYQQADVFVLPSVAEGFGHVYLEALSCGTPVICTENTGAADIIEHGKSGWIIPAGDRDALSSLLSWCMEHRQIVRDMRQAARQVAERHSWAQFRHALRASVETH